MAMFPMGGSGTWTFGLHQSSEDAFTESERLEIAKGKQLLHAAADRAKETARGAMRAPSRIGNSLKRRASVADSSSGGRTSRLDKLKDRFRSSTSDADSEYGCPGLGGPYGLTSPAQRCASAMQVQGPRVASTPEPFATARQRPISLQFSPTARLPPRFAEPQTPIRQPSVSARRAISRAGILKNKVTKPVALSTSSEVYGTAPQSSSPTPTEGSVVTVVKWPPHRRRHYELTAAEMIKELGRQPPEQEETFFRCDIYGKDGSDFVNAIEECMHLVQNAGGKVLEGEWSYPGGFLYDMSMTPDPNPLRDGDPTPASGYIRVSAWKALVRATYRPAQENEKDVFPLKRRYRGSAKTFIERQKEKAQQRRLEAEALERLQSSAVSAITAVTQQTSRLNMDTSRLEPSIIYPDSIHSESDEEPEVMVATPTTITPVRAREVDIPQTTQPSFNREIMVTRTFSISSFRLGYG